VVSKTGQRIYKNMQRASQGNLVLHFYKDMPFGRDEDYYFCGISTVAAEAKILTTEPPQPGDWAGRGRYFRIDVEHFSAFTDPLSMSDFIERKGPLIFEGPAGGELSFVLNDGKVRLAQGKYLASCPRYLYELLSSSIDEHVGFPVTTQPTSLRKGGKRAQRSFDYEEYVEEHYLHLGEGYIEIHHLNPLSEQNEASGNKKLSKLSEVTVLCANCHRMIHRLIRKERRAVTLEEFRACLA
jgi:hypothetical protein